MVNNTVIWSVFLVLKLSIFGIIFIFLLGDFCFYAMVLFCNILYLRKHLQVLLGFVCRQN